MFWDKAVTAIRNICQPAENTIIGIDIGSTKIASVVAHVDKHEKKIVGMATVPFKGVVWDGEDSVGVITDAIRMVSIEAFKSAGCSTKSAVIGISNIAKGITSSGLISINGKVSPGDIRRAEAVAANILVSEDLTLVEQVTNTFTVDDLEGVVNPLGMACSRLEAHLHSIYGRRLVLDKVKAASRFAGLKIRQVRSAELAAAKILLSYKERQQGVCLLDIGGEFSTLLGYEFGALRYAVALPWGGNHLTSCVALRLGLDRSEAEKVKLTFSRRDMPCATDEVVRSVLEERLRELCTLVKQELYRSGLDDALDAGIVLTGGTGKLPGLLNLFEEELIMPARLAVLPDEKWLQGLPLEYAGAVGLVQSYEYGS